MDGLRVDRLSLEGTRVVNPARRARARKGSSSMRLVRPGTRDHESASDAGRTAGRDR
jgi:hypothetical protein